MEPRSSLSTPEPDITPVQEVIVEGTYEKELGEISPELSRAGLRVQQEVMGVDEPPIPQSDAASSGEMVVESDKAGAVPDERKVNASDSESRPTGASMPEVLMPVTVAETPAANVTDDTTRTSLKDTTAAPEDVRAADASLEAPKSEYTSEVVEKPDQLQDQMISNETETSPAADRTSPGIPATERDDVQTKLVEIAGGEDVGSATSPEQKEEGIDAVAEVLSSPQPEIEISNTSTARPLSHQDDVAQEKAAPAPQQPVHIPAVAPNELVPQSPARDSNPDLATPEKATSVPADTFTAQSAEEVSSNTVEGDVPTESGMKGNNEAVQPTAGMDQPASSAAMSCSLSQGTPGDFASDPVVTLTGPAKASPLAPQNMSDVSLDAPQDPSSGHAQERPPTSSNTSEARFETGSPRTAPPATLERLLLSESTSSDLTSLPSNFSLEQVQSSDRSDDRRVPESQQEDRQMSSASQGSVVAHQVETEVLASSIADPDSAKDKVIESDSAAIVAPVAGSSVPENGDGVIVNADGVQSATPRSGTVPSSKDATDSSAQNVEAQATTLATTTLSDATEAPEQQQVVGDKDSVPVSPQAPVMASPPAAPATVQPPKVKFADPIMTQRMLEKQAMLGRRNIMSLSKSNRQHLTDKVHHLKRQYSKLDKEWEAHKTRIISENEELARQLETVTNPASVQEPKPGGRKTRRGFVEQDHELMGFRDGDEEALAKALKAIEEMMEADPTQRALKTEAMIPDMELDPDIWRLAYDDENALVRDPLVYYNHGMGEQPGEWTEEEERKFRKLYAIYPKQFGEIAKGLPNKTTAQCVKHYYLTKKKRPFKEGAKGNGQRQAAGGQAARMVAPVTLEKVELAGVLATGDRAQAKQVADNIRSQGDKKSGKRKADDVEKSGDRRKSGKKRLVDPAAGESVTPEGVSKKRKTQVKKPTRLDLKEARAQSTSNRSSVSVGRNADELVLTGSAVFSRSIHGSTHGRSAYQRAPTGSLYTRRRSSADQQSSRTASFDANCDMAGPTSYRR